MSSPQPGRNDPCHCGSGKKYKKCHADQDEAAASASLRKSAPQQMGGNALELMGKLREMAGPNMSMEDLHSDLAALAQDMSAGAQESSLPRLQAALLTMLEDGAPLGALRYDRAQLLSVVAANIHGLSLEKMDEHIRILFERCVPALAPSIPSEAWHQALRRVLRSGVTPTQRRALMLPLLEGVMGAQADVAASARAVLPTLVFIRQCQDELTAAQLRLQSLRDQEPDATMESIQAKVEGEGNPFLTLVVNSALAQDVADNVSVPPPPGGGGPTVLP